MRILFITLGLLFLITGCRKAPGEKSTLPSFNTTVSDLKGNELKELYAGLKVRFVSESFRPYNAQGTLAAYGWIELNGQRIRVQQASANYLIFEMPFLGFVQPIGLQSRVGINQSAIADLVIAQLHYRPTVTGSIYKGITGGVWDRSFKRPAEMTHDATGNLYVIDQDHSGYDTIRRISTTGMVTTIAATGTRRLVGIGIDASRNRLYIADATTQQIKYTSLSAPGAYTLLAGSGAAGNMDGTGTGASFNFGSQLVSDFVSNERGQGLTVDAFGNIIVGETYPGMLGSQLRKISPTGIVTTVPGSRIIAVGGEDETAVPAGIAVSGSNIYSVAGFSGSIQGVVKFTPGGTFTRFSGGESYEELVDGTGGVVKYAFPKAISAIGSFLFVADGANGALRRINIADGSTITIAGVGRTMTNSGAGSGYIAPLEGSFRMRSVFSGITTPPDPNYYINAARAIRMDQVGGVTAVEPGLIYVSDYGYKCIWKITIR